jgi:penicillin-binding protein 2
MSAHYLPNNEQEAKEFSPRYKLIYGLIAVTTVLFFSRLWYLQIINGNELRQFSEQNSIKETKIPAPRGIVYDRNGQILVENLLGFEATIAPQYVTNLEDTAEAVGRALKIPGPSIVLAVQRSRRMNGPFRPVRLKENLTREEILSLELLKWDYSGIDIKEAALRSYPLKENGAQLFGYVGEISKKQLPILNDRYQGRIKFQQGDIIGKSGLEEYLDAYLRGHDGISVMQVDARGREAQTEAPSFIGAMNGIQDAVPGDNILLTIDKDIQEAAYRAFADTGRIGGVVVMKTNGEILAWVNSPSFDPNEFSTGISGEIWSKLINDPDKPLRNKVIQDHNSPGSTFKPLVALAALSEKVVSPTTIVSSPGQMKFGNRLYHDSEKGGHGNLMITQAIEQSANIFFYKMGIALGIDKMYKYIDAVGIGHKTGVDLYGEVPGLMPNSEWKKNTIGEEWQPGENLSNAIGQGFVLTTPLQMAVAYNVIGTEGHLVKPLLVRKILSPDNKVVKEFEPQQIRDLTQGKSPNDVVIDKKVFQTVKEGLRLVVNGERGTARGSKLPFVEIAGKTGTSQVMSFSVDQIYVTCESRPKYQRHHGWFIGYAPADHPEIAFGVLAEHACHGASGAAPVAREVVRAWVTKYHPEWLARDLRKKILLTGDKKLSATGAPLPAPTPVKAEESVPTEKIEGE